MVPKVTEIQNTVCRGLILELAKKNASGIVIVAIGGWRDAPQPTVAYSPALDRKEVEEILGAIFQAFLLPDQKIWTMDTGQDSEGHLHSLHALCYSSDFSQDKAMAEDALMHLKSLLKKL